MTSTSCAPAARPAGRRRCCGARPTSTCPRWPAPRSATAESIAPAADGRQRAPWYAVPPLMHAAAQWTAYAGLHSGATIVLHDDSQAFDARAILEPAEREQVLLMAIVGDAYARPLVEELRRRTLRPVARCSCSAPAARPPASTTRRRCSSCCRTLTIRGRLRRVGDGRHGVRGPTKGVGPRASARLRARPSCRPTATRFLEPGDDEIGWTARRGRVPLGYLGDREQTEATFPIVDGDAWRSRATGAAARDGRIRDARPRLDGGEHRRREGVRRGGRGGARAATPTSPTRWSSAARPSASARRWSRWCSPGRARSRPGDASRVRRGRDRPLQGAAGGRVCDAVRRHANGKADYVWAKEVAASAVDATAAVG